VAGATASANLYSLLQTCQLNGIDGYRYLSALFTALPNARTADDYAALLPWRVKLAPSWRGSYPCRRRGGKGVVH
jgi:hypothetical protein